MEISWKFTLELTSEREGFGGLEGGSDGEDEGGGLLRDVWRGENFGGKKSMENLFEKK